MTVPIERVGRILAGDEAGRFVEVLDDSPATRGFLILTSPDPTFASDSCFDNWVADRGDLIGYFLEAGWKIEWL